MELGKDQPVFRSLASNRGLPSQHLSMLLVRSYRTFAPLPGKSKSNKVKSVPFTLCLLPSPSAVCFCGTILTIARTGRYPASLVFRKPGLSSGCRQAHKALATARNRLRLLSF